jgi:hypothetical protein
MRLANLSIVAIQSSLVLLDIRSKSVIGGRDQGLSRETVRLMCSMVYL